MKFYFLAFFLFLSFFYFLTFSFPWLFKNFFFSPAFSFFQTFPFFKLFSFSTFYFFMQPYISPFSFRPFFTGITLHDEHSLQVNIPHNNDIAPNITYLKIRSSFAVMYCPSISLGIY